MRESLIEGLQKEIVEGSSSSSSSSATAEEVIAALEKMQVHLIRVMSCEFLFHHVIQNVSNLN